MSVTDLAVVILAKNEAVHLKHYLNQLAWCKQRIVVDDYSEDKTVEIAQLAGAMVLSRRLNGNFAGQRNFALKHVTTEWVLFVDADEVVSASLVDEIRNAITGKDVAFRIRRVDVFLGKKLRHGETAGWNQVRLAKKNYGKWVGAVHEEWRGDGSVGQLKTPLLHEPHQSVSEFLKAINYYTTLRARELFKKREPVNGLAIVIYPLLKFMQNYFGKWGFLDGTHGFVHASLMGFHSFLVRSKLYLLYRKENEHSTV